ncbi:hypothetical protein ACFQ9Z_36220 [Streptomyces sp. NPDC056580]|uniref:hypothetical protein n=1 Tax=Streptomyces sp. NPDC056580 TaxID=3345872 RepID=UPI003699320E
MSFLLDRWLGVAQLDETSYDRAEGIIRNYLKPTFGDLKAGKLTAETLELFYARLRQCQGQCEGRRNGKTDPKTKHKHLCEPLAANSVRKIHFILRPALNRGLRWGYVTTNVAALAEPPSQPKPNPDPPTPEEAALVLNTAWQREQEHGVRGTEARDGHHAKARRGARPVHEPDGVDPRNRQVGRPGDHRPPEAAARDLLRLTCIARSRSDSTGRAPPCPAAAAREPQPYHCSIPKATD